MLFNEGLCRIQTDALPLDSMDTTQAVRTGEVEMTATLQSANDRLRQLEKDNLELSASFAELEELRKIVRQKQAIAGRTRLGAPTSFVNPSSGFHTAGCEEAIGFPAGV